VGDHRDRPTDRHLRQGDVDLMRRRKLRVQAAAWFSARGMSLVRYPVLRRTRSFEGAV